MAHSKVISMKFSLLQFKLSLLCIIFTSVALANEKSVSLSFVDYPPYYSQDLQNDGPISEIIALAYKKQGYKVSTEQLPWARALEWTKEGKYDGIYTAWYREDRKEHFAFSSPLPANEIVLFKHKNTQVNFKSYADLKPYLIGIVRGYANPPGFDDAGLKTAAVTSDKQNLLKLSDSRIDLALVDKATGNHIIRTKIPAMQEKLDWVSPPLKVDPQYIMFSRKAPNFETKLNDFNAGLKQITDSGELQEILDKHGL